jgi:hypothetical protein
MERRSSAEIFGRAISSLTRPAPRQGIKIPSAAKISAKSQWSVMLFAVVRGRNFSLRTAAALDNIMSRRAGQVSARILERERTAILSNEFGRAFASLSARLKFSRATTIVATA